MKAPEEIREERDRALMLEYVRLGEAKGAIQAIQAKFPKINLRTIYRARDRQLEWAREQHSQREKHSEDDGA